MRKAYPSDLTDEQWAILEPLIPQARPGGRPREVDMREVVNTLLYQGRAGCQWDMLPHDLVPKSTAWDYFARWRDDGTWQRLLDALRQQARLQADRQPTPSAGSLDSQTVKAAGQGGQRGYDAAKRTAGRKRHMAVDTLGFLLAVTVTAASADDGATAARVVGKLRPESYPRLKHFWVDHKYHNLSFYDWLRRQGRGYTIEVVSRPQGAKGFVLLPRRWVVERSFAWLGRYRRLSKDYERLPASSEAWIVLCNINLLLNRLAPKTSPKFHYREKTLERPSG